MRLVLVLAALAVAALVAPAAASACSFAPDSDGERMRKADLVVHGKVTARRLVRRDENTGTDHYRYRFRVLETFKGRKRKRIRLEGHTNTAMCGAGLLRVGERFTFMLNGKRGPWPIAAWSFVRRSDVE